jgi:hypothetical protein
MVAHACYQALRRQRQEALEFKGSLSYIARLCFRGKKRKEIEERKTKDWKRRAS